MIDSYTQPGGPLLYYSGISKLTTIVLVVIQVLTFFPRSLAIINFAESGFLHFVQSGKKKL